MNRKCKNFVKHFSAYIDGELSPNLKEAVEKHLASCADCAERLNRLTALSERSEEALNAVADSTSPPAGIPTRVMSEARARRAQLRTIRAFRRLAVAAGTALLVVVVGGAVLFAQMRHEERMLKASITERDAAVLRAQKQLQEAQERHEKSISALHFRMGELLERFERFSPRTAFFPTEGLNL
jgi:anti-sigma factor RsiW